MKAERRSDVLTPAAELDLSGQTVLRKRTEGDDCCCGGGGGGGGGMLLAVEL